MTGPASSPLLADYVHKDALGKASALIGIGFVLGEIVSMGVLFKITAPMSHNAAFLTCALVGLAFASLFLFIVKEPQLREKDATGNNEAQAEEMRIDREDTSDNQQLSDEAFK